MNTNEFLEQLRQSCLLAPDQVQLFVDRCDARQTPAALAASLVADELLTAFQAQKILAGDARQLVLEQYRLVEELGRGGMGEVFKAFHTVMGRVVAIKLLAPMHQADSHALGWFQREVQALTQLQHPNIVMAYDANEVDGRLFLVMEYVEGNTLERLVRTRGPLPIPQACEMLLQAALALQYAHEKGMVHRDIKPANLLIPTLAAIDTPTQRLPEPVGGSASLRQPPALVKIVDFGLARLRSSAGSQTIAVEPSQGFVGTPDFASPEQCRDIHGVDIRSDLYSLGCTLHFALTGSVPFEGGSATEKLIRHLTEPPPGVELRRPDVPPGVAVIIRQLLAKNPEERYQTPLELARALEPWCGRADALRSPGECAGRQESGDRVDGDALADMGGARQTRAIPAAAAPVSPTELFLAAVAAGTSRPAEPEVPAGGNLTPSTPELACLSSDTTPLVLSSSETIAPAPAPDPSAPADGADAYATEVQGGLGPKVLLDCWRQWTRIIASATDRSGRGSWNPASYRLLHQTLLASCRQVGNQGSAQRRGFLRQLEELIRPWVSLESVEQTEPEILRCLLSRCREADKILGIHRPLAELVRGLCRGGPALLLVLLLGVAASAGWILWSGLGSGPRRVDWRTFLAALQRGSPTEWALVALPVILVTALVWLIRWR